MVVLVLNKLGYIVFFTGILGAFGGFKSTLVRMGLNYIPGGYITKFYSLVMDISYIVEEVSGFRGNLM